MLPSGGSWRLAIQTLCKACRVTKTTHNPEKRVHGPNRTFQQVRNRHANIPSRSGKHVGFIILQLQRPVRLNQLSAVTRRSVLKVGERGAEGSSRSAGLPHRGGGSWKPRAMENVAKKRTSCPTACSQAVVHAHDPCAALFGPRRRAGP